jgi:hypothetical protein
MVLDGKISGQPLRARITCAKCSSIITTIKQKNISLQNRIQAVNHCLGEETFIYETKSGKSVVYCSKYCRNQHNHRFNKSNCEKC